MLLLDRPSLGLRILVDHIVGKFGDLGTRRRQLRLGTGWGRVHRPGSGAIRILGVGQADCGRLIGGNRDRCQRRSSGQRQLGVLGRIDR